MPCRMLLIPLLLRLILSNTYDDDDDDLHIFLLFLRTVDWAALAQQWIKMKETVVPPAPPPPNINPMYSANDGSGEAPMDVDTKDDDVPPAPPAPNISGSGT